MAELKWDQTGERIYETGDKNVALYVYDDTNPEKPYPKGVAWNGITGISETPSGAEATDLWADDTKYATMRSAEQFGGTIEAYTYPEEWEECDGSVSLNGVTAGQQARKAFGLAYITTVGNDTKLNDYGEKIHLIYGATASPSERTYSTINDSPEAITFSWEFETTPVEVGTFAGVEIKKTSCLTISSIKPTKGDWKEKTQADWDKVYRAFKKKIYGDTDVDPYLPLPAEVFGAFDASKAETLSVNSGTPVYQTSRGESRNDY